MKGKNQLRGQYLLAGFLYSYFFYLLKKNVDTFLIDQLGRKTFPLIDDDADTDPESENFQTEYKMFNDKISAVSDESVRLELQGILQNLLKEVKYLDQQHQDLSSNNRLPSSAIDSRQNITLIRKNLINKLRDWKEVKG